MRPTKQSHCARRSCTAAATAIAVWLTTACSPSDADRQRSRDESEQVVDVVTAVAVVKPMGLQIEAVGTAYANESVDVTSKTSNTITAIRFDEGARVRRGAVLVEFDDAQTRAALAEAEAELTDAEGQFNRSRDLFAQKALSQAQLDQLEATLKASRARVNAAKARLDDTVIRAAFNGRTGFRRVSVGSLVSPGTVITTLDDTSVIKLDFTVPEAYLFALERGLSVTATTAGYRGEVFRGKVTNLESRVDPVTRSITVRAEIPNDDGRLRPGMFMTVSLQGDPVPTLMIPESAIVPEQGKAFVFAVADDVVEQREVATGRRRPGEVEIVSGLREGERVVVEGTQNVEAGTRVRELESAPTELSAASAAGT